MAVHTCHLDSRFLWVTCVSLLISSAYVSVSMMCVSSDRRCSRTVDPDDFFVHICGIKCRVMLRWVTCLSLLIASTHARYIRMSRCYVLFQKGLWRRKRYDWMFKRCLFYVQLILIDGNERWPAWGQRVTRVSHGTLRRTIWQKICCTRTWRWICVRMLKSNMVQKFSSVFSKDWDMFRSLGGVFFLHMEQGITRLRGVIQLGLSWDCPPSIFAKRICLADPCTDIKQ